jgi:hypothetical protein
MESDTSQPLGSGGEKQLLCRRNLCSPDLAFSPFFASHWFSLNVTAQACFSENFISKLSKLVIFKGKYLSKRI